jgi:protein gp37
MENSKIEWCDHTFNPWIGCQHVSPGCDRCYAEHMMDHRYGKVKWGPHGKRVRTSGATWNNPRRWNANAPLFVRVHGHRPRVFCASLADVFDNKAPEGARDDLFRLIRETPKQDWLLLTKRPQNIAKKLPADWGDGYPNVWLGITAEDNERYRMRWPILSRIPAVVRFVSYEPAIAPLGSIDIGTADCLPDWIICGGESGNGARRMKPAWVRSLLEECADLGIAFFMKQIGSNHDGWPMNVRGKGVDMDEWPQDLRVRQFPSGKKHY